MRDPRAAPDHLTALRLWTQASSARPPEPPLGYRHWDPAATATAVWLTLLASPARGSPRPAELSAIASQLPEPDRLPPGTPVLVLGSAVRAEQPWLRWLGDRRVTVPRVLRCSALLIRGYVDLGGSADEDLAWGWSS